MRISTRLKKNISKTRIPDYGIAIFVILATLLPYLHEFLIGDDGLLLPWVPFEERRVFNYSKVGPFLFYLLIQVYALIGLVFWKHHLVGKRHGKYLWVPILSAIYHLIILFCSARGTAWNEPTVKFIGICTVLLGIMVWDYYSEAAYRQRNKRAFRTFGGPKTKIIGPKEITWLVGVLSLSCMLFVHDFVTSRIGGGTLEWLPDFGIVKALTETSTVDGEAVERIWDFKSYRILLYTFMVQVYVFVCWLCAHMSGKGRPYRPFFIVPLALGIFQILLIVVKSSGGSLNNPDVKLWITLGCALLAATIFLYKYRHLVINSPKQI